MKIVKLLFKTANGNLKNRTFIKVKGGFIPIEIIEHLEEHLDIISEKDIFIDENTGEIR